jgi:hypothetical protein
MALVGILAPSDWVKAVSLTLNSELELDTTVVVDGYNIAHCPKSVLKRMLREIRNRLKGL